MNRTCRKRLAEGRFALLPRPVGTLRGWLAIAPSSAIRTAPAWRAHPRQFRWSSYGINAEGKASHLIAPHGPYVRLGRGPDARREAYRALFRDALDEAVVNEIRAVANGGFVLGAARFHEQTAAQLGRRVTSAQAGRPPRKHPERASVGPNGLQARPGRIGSRRRKSRRR
ncbi:hypothetical protein [Bradyrhizobium sp.]|uniref:hypothetical protein n=1 Tax=Bradyrhizobium sp. TaxID=376 RepID=UPI003C1A3BD0